MTQVLKMNRHINSCSLHQAPNKKDYRTNCTSFWWHLKKSNFLRTKYVLHWRVRSVHNLNLIYSSILLLVITTQHTVNSTWRPEYPCFSETMSRIYPIPFAWERKHLRVMVERYIDRTCSINCSENEIF